MVSCGRKTELAKSQFGEYSMHILLRLGLTSVFYLRYVPSPRPNTSLSYEDLAQSAADRRSAVVARWQMDRLRSRRGRSRRQQNDPAHLAGFLRGRRAAATDAG